MDERPAAVASDDASLREASTGASRLNVLSLNTDLPIFPGGGGVEFLALTELARRAATVGLVSMAHSRQDLDRSAALTARGVRLYLWKSPWLDSAPAGALPVPFVRRTYRALRDGLAAGIASRGRPADTRMMDGALSNMAPSLIDALAERPWHVLSVVQSSAAAMFDAVPRPLVSVLVMHDIRARLYERRALVATSWFQAWRLRREARRYHAFERDHARRVDLVVTVSTADARWVTEHYQPARVYALPLPVDTAHFAPADPSDECDGRIVFTGLLNHPPNVDAAIAFATDVLPAVRARVPHAEFHVVGRNPVPDVEALAAHPGVRVFANVPDIRTHIGGASVIVAPLRYGSGARQKILEAWSMEKCVVATTIGAEGLEYTDQANVLIADTPEALATTVADALGHPEIRARLRRGGRAVVVQHHAPSALSDGYFRELTTVALAKAASDSPMRVLLDMRWMLPGLAGGLENLARAFVAQLMELDRYNRYVLHLPSQCRHDFDLRHRANMRTVATDSPTAIARRIMRGVADRAAARLRLHRWQTPAVRQLGWLRDLDVEMAYSFPGYIHPDLRPLRQVLVVPDIQHEYFPEFFSPDALDERRRLYTESAHRADHICAISAFTKQTLVEKLGVAADKITPVLLAADPEFHAAGSPEQDAPTLAAHGLTRGTYLFLPAHTWPHKNHRTLIEALRVLRDRHGRRPTLICTGGAREAQPVIEAQIAAAGLEGQVRFLGYVPRGDVPTLYRGAAALVFPSLFEGFGMPVLEAMASGCPVVCSNTTSLPEIAGEAALQVSPTDAEAMASAIARVLDDSELRTTLGARGLRRAAEFSWRRHTLETIAVLRRVHDQTRHL